MVIFGTKTGGSEREGGEERERERERKGTRDFSFFSNIYGNRVVCFRRSEKKS